MKFICNVSWYLFHVLWNKVINKTKFLAKSENMGLVTIQGLVVWFVVKFWDFYIKFRIISRITVSK